MMVVNVGQIPASMTRVPVKRHKPVGIGRSGENDRWPKPYVRLTLRECIA